MPRLLDFRDLMKRTDAARLSGIPLTVADISPELAEMLGDDLAQRSFSEIFRMDLLGVAPATWLSDPPLPNQIRENVAVLERFLDIVKGLVEQSEGYATLQMIQNHGALALMGFGLKVMLAGGPKADELRGTRADFTGPSSRKRLFLLESFKLLVSPQNRSLRSMSTRGCVLSRGSLREWYLPSLMAAFDVLRLAEGKSPCKWGKHPMMGQIFQEAEKALGELGDPLQDNMRTLLRPTTRLLRNAEAHSSANVDITRSVVVVEQREFTKEDIEAEAGALMSTCVSMRAAFTFMLNEDFVRGIKAESFGKSTLDVRLSPNE